MAQCRSPSRGDDLATCGVLVLLWCCDYLDVGLTSADPFEGWLRYQMSGQGVWMVGQGPIGCVCFLVVASLLVSSRRRGPKPAAVDPQGARPAA